jgi:hypothetical protein
MQTTKVHNIGDDLESFLYVLTMVAIKYAQNSMDSRSRSLELKNFDHVFGGVGGFLKAKMLRGDSSTIHAFGLDQKPFSDLLKVLFSKFGLRYGSTRFLDMDSIDSAAAAAEVQELETHDWLCGVLDKALKDDVWKEAEDKAVEQEVLKEERYLTDANKKRKSTVEAYKAEREAKRPKAT